MSSNVIISVLLSILLLAIGGHGQEQQPLVPKTSPQPRRVAIIGAGAAGASTAYYLRNNSLHAGIPVDITVYDRNLYVGGRSTTVNVHNVTTESVELGASIFVAFTTSTLRLLGLSGRKANDTRTTRSDGGEDDLDTLLGIWDGQSFVYTQSTAAPSSRLTSWYRSLRLLYYYGFVPLRFLRLVDGNVNRFLGLYDEPHFPFPSLADAVRDVGLTPTVAVEGWEVSAAEKLNGKFTWDVVQAATRVNYASNLDEIHGMGMLVSMATDGAMAVFGGNWQIFFSMISDSGAKLRLNTAVVSVDKLANGKYSVKSHQVKPLEDDERGNAFVNADEKIFDEVVLAAPFHQSGIDFLGDTLAHTPANDKYRTLHVTLFSSPHRLSREYFGIRDQDLVPTTVLTTLSGMPPSGAGDEHAQRQHLPFYSISTLRSVQNPHSGRHEYLYKIFSPEPFSNASLGEVLDRSATLGAIHVGDEGLREGDVSWLYRKEWLSYPILKPRTEFEPVRLDVSRDDDVVQKGGLWYTSGMEGFISTMETSSLMGANVARLMIDSWKLEGFTPNDSDWDSQGKTASRFKLLLENATTLVNKAETMTGNAEHIMCKADELHSRAAGLLKQHKRITDRFASHTCNTLTIEERQELQETSRESVKQAVKSSRGTRKMFEDMWETTKDVEDTMKRLRELVELVPQLDAKTKQQLQNTLERWEETKTIMGKMHDLENAGIRSRKELLKLADEVLGYDPERTILWKGK